MLELRWLQVPETTTKPPTLQYRIHQPVVDIGGHLCPGDWTDWKDVPTVVGEPSDTAPPPAAQQRSDGEVIQRHVVTKYSDGSVQVADVTAPPPSVPVVPDWITGDGMQGIKAEAHFLTQHTDEAVQRAGARLLERADKIISALAQQPAAVNDLNARRAAFVAERAMRYREGGMAIEQARIHAETDAAHMEAQAAPPQEPGNG